MTPPPPQFTAKVSGFDSWESSGSACEHEVRDTGVVDSTVAHRLRLYTSYSGTDFHGWAVQPGLRTVERAVTEALNLITGGSYALTVTGRTDTGVHVRGQAAHIDVSENELVRAARRAGDPC